MSSCNRNFSSIVVDGTDRAPNRSMLRAVGFEDEDFKKFFERQKNLLIVENKNPHLQSAELGD